MKNTGEMVICKSLPQTVSRSGKKFNCDEIFTIGNEYEITDVYEEESTSTVYYEFDLPNVGFILMESKFFE